MLEGLEDHTETKTNVVIISCNSSMVHVQHSIKTKSPVHTWYTEALSKLG